MHNSTVFTLLGLALSGSVAAQKPERAYCDFYKPPNKGDCWDIKDHGIRDNSYYKDDEWWSGNCRVKVSGGPISGSLSSIQGSWLKRMVQDVLDNCDSGFKYHGGVRVEVALCEIGMYGKKTQCSSPLKKVGGFPEKKIKKRDDTNAPDILKRHHLTDVGNSSSNNPREPLAPRGRNSPWPGLECGAGPGTSTVANCKAALDELRGMKEVTLPYKKDSEGCQIQIWPINRNYRTTKDTTIAHQIEHDLAACADSTGQYVGFLQNYRGEGYHWFAGAFCGAFGTGRPGNCWMGGK